MVFDDPAAGICFEVTGKALTFDLAVLISFADEEDRRTALLIGLKSQIIAAEPVVLQLVRRIGLGQYLQQFRSYFHSGAIRYLLGQT